MQLLVHLQSTRLLQLTSDLFAIAKFLAYMQNFVNGVVLMVETK